jgi:predicted acetyltransferase
VSLSVAPVEDSRRGEWWQIQGTVFAFEMKDEERALHDAWTEWDRAYAAADGETMVGSAANFSLSVVVPGGADVPMAGLTAVAVLPTHRRRGALTAMIRATIDDARDHGEPLAGLWASESGIYGRFGYGAAIEGAELKMTRPHTAMMVEAPSTGRVRLIDVDTARTLVPDLYRRATAGVPGTIERSAPAWDMYFYDPEHWRAGASANQYAAYEVAGEFRGFVRYRVKEKWEDEHPRYTVRVRDLHARDADAYAALHRYLFGMDLVETIEFIFRRRHEPLLHLLVEPRRMQRRLHDHLWVRILDVPGALEARRYGTEGSVVLEVTDDFCPWVEGRYRLAGGPDGAECSTTDAEAQVRISAADLASAYLGDSRLPSLAWIGKVDGDPAAIVLLHRMLSWPIEPLCTVMF